MARAVRAIVLVAMTIFATGILLLLGSGSVQPVGEQVKDTGSNLGTVGGVSIINSVYDSVFIYVPLMLIGGILVFGTALILFRERFTGRRGF